MPVNPRINDDKPLVNAISVDVEDYFQVSAFRNVVSPDDWDSFPSRVVQNTQRVLDLFDRHAVKGTFFVLGWVAERHPALVREIHQRGHEVACHGYSHKLVYEQTPEEFRDETVRSKALLEDATGVAVRGYRAASFSIVERSRWALDVLVDCGFAYDSSMYPTRHDLYGIAVDELGPHEIEAPGGGRLTEFPMTVAKVGGMTIPVSGGGYFRLYPYPATAWLLRQVNSAERPFVFYLHPWELDPDQPRIAAPLKSRVRHYLNLKSCEEKLERLLRAFALAPMVTFDGALVPAASTADERIG